ncbi:AcrR family transcriptional regulator [Paenibacillus mucilaginosus]|uniref:TetR/AcrR family transcriptional regulator n=1 Tax=Paenibacillus mucilaginosus TaxID=61624 RepID=UPI003D19EA3D
MRRSKEEAHQTIRRLTEVARAHFTENGYVGASLESIVQEADVTRGAVYHHFRSKKELFRIVLEAVQLEVAEQVEAAASAADEVWEQLYRGCRAFVLAAVEQSRKRILLVDGPAIMGWDVWRAMDEKYSMRLLREQLELMQEQGHIPGVSAAAMAHFLSGALNETSLWLASRTPDAADLDNSMNVIRLFLDGIRKHREDLQTPLDHPQ